MNFHIMVQCHKTIWQYLVCIVEFRQTIGMEMPDMHMFSRKRGSG